MSTYFQSGNLNVSKNGSICVKTPEETVSIQCRNDGAYIVCGDKEIRIKDLINVFDRIKTLENNMAELILLGGSDGKIRNSGNSTD